MRELGPRGREAWRRWDATTSNSVEERAWAEKWFMALYTGTARL